MLVLLAIAMMQTPGLEPHPCVMESKRLGVRVSYPKSWKITYSDSGGKNDIPPNWNHLTLSIPGGASMVIEMSSRNVSDEPLGDLKKRPQLWKHAMSLDSFIAKGMAQGHLPFSQERITVSGFKGIATMIEYFSEGRTLSEGVSCMFLSKTGAVVDIDLGVDKELDHDQTVARLANFHGSKRIILLPELTRQLPTFKAVIGSLTFFQPSVSDRRK